MDPINRAASAAIREAIRSAGRTQSSVWRDLQLSQSTWKARIRGRRPFTLPELNGVAAALDRPLVDLMQAVVIEMEEQA